MNTVMRKIKLENREEEDKVRNQKDDDDEIFASHPDTRPIGKN